MVPSESCCQIWALLSDNFSMELMCLSIVSSSDLKKINTIPTVGSTGGPRSQPQTQHNRFDEDATMADDGSLWTRRHQERHNTGADASDVFI